MNLRHSSPPDFTTLLGIKRIGRADHQMPVRLQVSSHVLEKLARIIQMLDNFTGNNGVKLPTNIHDLNIPTNRIVTSRLECLDPLCIQIQSNDVWIYLDQLEEKYFIRTTNPLLCSSVCHTGIHHSQIQNIPVPDIFSKHLDTICNRPCGIPPTHRANLGVGFP